MPKKQSSKQRTKVKDLSKESKKLKTGDMKKVKGGGFVGRVFVASGDVNNDGLVEIIKRRPPG